MKKVLAFLLAAGMVFTLPACDASSTILSRKDADGVPSSAEQETSTEVSDELVDPAADGLYIVLTVGNDYFSTEDARAGIQQICGRGTKPGEQPCGKTTVQRSLDGEPSSERSVGGRFCLA